METSRPVHHPFELAVPLNGSDHVLGPDNAAVVVIEFGDFECPNCRQAYPAVKQLLQHFQQRVRFAYRHFPLTEIHPHAQLAAEAAEAAGVRLLAVGTGPASGPVPPVDDKPRFHQMIDRYRLLVPSPGTNGMHVHVAMPDRSTAIDLMNAARYFLPHLLALSTSSPFWMGRDTGLKSYRTAIFRRFPRTGIPDHFGSWGEYESYVNLLVGLHCIDDAKKIWWDIRPHPTFGTLEFRVCDVPTRVEETLAIAALSQAVIVKLHRLYSRNMGFRLYRRAYIDENKWRAARWGLDGRLIDFGKKEEVPARALTHEMLDFVDPVLDELGSRQEVESVLTILERGTGADRQLKVFDETHDLRAVVDYIIEETRAGLFEPTPGVSRAIKEQ